VTPADCSFWMMSGAWVVEFDVPVFAVVVADEMSSTSGLCTPARFKSGSRYLFSASWSLVRLPAMTATFLELPSSPVLSPQLTVAWMNRRIVGTGPPEVGAAFVVHVDTVAIH